MSETTPPINDVTILRPTASNGESASSEQTGSSYPIPGVDAPKVLKQRFVLEEKLGSGGMGTVFRAKDLRKVEAQDRQPYVAVKVLNNDFRKHPEAFVALEREASKSQKLSHPNIVSIFDFDKDGDLPYIIMELLEGRELTDCLKDFPNGLPDDMLWSVVEGLCAGLGHAHGAQLVHADFKPGNVLVSAEGHAKIFDFGIARAVRQQRYEGETTIFDPASLAALTPAYASREMLKGDTPLPKDDIYSLGVVIYQMVTGHHPFGRLSADEAAQESLVPERPKRLSSRQWRALRQALAFHRAQRPDSVTDLRRGLLEPSPWRSRTAYAAVAAFILAIGISTFWEDSQRAEVEQEVRQITLLDVQLERVDALLAKPIFNLEWHQAVREELAVLAALPGAEQARQKRLEQLGQLYATQVQEASDAERALELYQRGSEFIELKATAEKLEQRMAQAVEGLLSAPQANLTWVQALDGALGRHRQAFPDSNRRTRLDGGVATALAGLVRQALAREEVQFARAALARINPDFLGPGTYPQLVELLETAQRRQSAAAEASAAAAVQAQYNAAMKPLLATSCIRFDFPKLVARFEALHSQFPSEASAGRSKFLAHTADCISELGQADRDRAQGLYQLAIAHFGKVGPLTKIQFDPCSMGYLVGTGAQRGGHGLCFDELSGDTKGPRLVVVSLDSDARIAITRQEISWSEFNLYCKATEACTLSEQDQMPVTNIDIDSAETYAVWLTEQTGFRYRLPSSVEWEAGAKGSPDPNRNCRVQAGGVQRGFALLPAKAGQANELGLVHLLGNAQEWVISEQGLEAAGGAYLIPLSECNGSHRISHDGLPDPVTGFRLVREIP